jgi:hypothetical protein
MKLKTRSVRPNPFKDVNTVRLLEEKVEGEENENSLTNDCRGQTTDKCGGLLTVSGKFRGVSS